MPHLVLECSDNISNKISFETIFKKLHQLLATSLPTQISSCKSRVITHDKCYIGDDFSKNSFIHLTIKIMAGRSDEVKQQVSKAVLKILEDLINHLNLDNVSVSVELIDLSAHYLKTKI